MSYDKVIKEKEIWRIFTSTFSHSSLIHLAFNMMVLWSVKFLEKSLGVLIFYQLCFFIILLSFIIEMLIFKILIILHFDQYHNIYSIGFSGVAFGLTTFTSFKYSSKFIDLFGFQISYSTSPFISLFITQLIIPNASFFGHLSGKKTKFSFFF